MLRHVVLVSAVSSLALAGCSIDRVEWESSGFPVEQVRHALEEEHGAEDPAVECIQREVQGGEWECRAHAGDTEYHCHVTSNTPRRRIYELECEAAHEKGHSTTVEDEGHGTEAGSDEH